MSFLDSWNDWSGSVDQTALDTGSTTLLAGLGNDPLGVGALLPGDVYDTQKMQGYTPPAAQQQGMPWWQSIVTYGAVRGIDNRFGSPLQVYGNTQPGYMAGQNGRTYAVGGVGGGLPILANQAGGGLIGWLMVAGLAYAVLKA